MNSQLSPSFQKRVYDLIAKHRLHDAFALISKTVTETDAWNIADELSAIETSYKYLISYFIAGSDDSRREQIRAEIIESLYTITDKVVIHTVGKTSGEQYFLTRRFTPSSLDALISTYKSRKSELDMFVESGNDSTDALRSLSVAFESAEASIFDYVWTRFPISGADITLLEDFIASGDVAVNTKVLMVAALYQSVVKFYQEPILALLLSLYTSPHDDVAVAALCCALIALHKYQSRAASSERINNIIATLSDDLNFRRDVASIYFVLTRSRDAERLSKRVHDELIPELTKLNPTIINKFKDIQSISDLTDIEANPEWRDLIESSKISKKVKEFHEMQDSGADVYMSTFGKLKMFPFFSRISNWFLPFHTSHSAVMSSFDSNSSGLKELIQAIPYLCDSDKYSFSISIGSIPDTQKNMLGRQFMQHKEMLNELEKNKPSLSIEKNHEDIANRFIQNLFRFSKFNKYRAEFYDPFSTSLNLRKIQAIAPIVDNTETLGVIGEYFMKNEHYDEAIECFTRIMEIDSEIDASFIQKRGFCHQCLKHYREAIDDYSKFDLFSPDNLWNITHTAACYRALRQHDRALEHYRRAEALSPENLSVCLNIGHCLLDLGNTAEALKAYYKVDYLDSTKHRALRPIAWCTFLLGNFEQSLNYYEKVMNDNPSPHDYLNMGHLHLCMRHFADAVGYYAKSIESFGSSDDFKSSFNTDVPYLSDKGITTMEIDLILDNLAYSQQS